MSKYVIGVDDGGTFIKAALYDEDGVLVASARERSVTTALPGGRVEVDLVALWEANCRCVRALVAGSGVDPADIRALGFAGQGKGLWVLGDGGAVIRRGITSADARAEEYAARWAADGTAERLFPITLQGIFSVHPVSLLAWLRDHEPEVYRQVRWILSMKDYLVFRATGRIVSDASNQSGNGLVDQATRRSAPEVLDAVGMPELRDCLPPLLESSEQCGVLTPDAAAELGCAPGTAVITGLFDINATAVAAGLVDEDVVCLITGTTGVNVYAAAEPVRDRSVAMNSQYCIPGLVLVEEGSNSSVGTLEWVIRSLFADQVDDAGRPPADAYARLERIAASTSPDASAAIFLPYLTGDEGSVDARGAWIGIGQTDGRPELVRAAYEGAAFAHRRHVERLLAHRPAPRTIRIAGGGTRSAFFVQLVADVLGTPIEVMADEELGAKGVAMAAGVAVGMYADFRDALARLTPTTRTVLPDPGLRPVYDAKYDRFIRTAERLRGPLPTS